MAEFFNAVLSGENPDGGAWSDAGAYLEAAGQSEKPSQAPILRILQKPIGQYRVLIVPGFMSACVTHSMWPGLPIVPSKSTGATDGKYLRAAGIPTYGVQGFALDRDNSRVHGKDERIAVRSFYEGRIWQARNETPHTHDCSGRALVMRPRLDADSNCRD